MSPLHFPSESIFIRLYRSISADHLSSRSMSSGLYESKRYRDHFRMLSSSLRRLLVRVSLIDLLISASIGLHCRYLSIQPIETSLILANWMLFSPSTAEIDVLSSQPRFNDNSTCSCGTPMTSAHSRE